MGILLWKFSQAPADYVGTTTWQKLVPPPDKTSVNSPNPLVDMSLPPLAMDGMVENGHDDSLFGTNQNFMSSNGHQYNMFSSHIDDELCQDGFINYRPEMLSGFDDLHSTFDLSTSNNTLDHNLNLSFDMSARDLPHLQDHATPSTNNFFEIHSQMKEGFQTTSLLPQPHRHGSIHENGDHLSNQPLANFDMNTHQRLQAQLGTDDRRHSPSIAQPETTTPLPTPTVHHSPVDPEDEALRVALLAASAISDLNGQQSQSQPHYLQAPSASQPAYIPSTANPFTSPPVAARPQLHTHHSFAGVGAADGLHSRQSSRGDFEKTLANLHAFTEIHDIHFPFDLTNGDNVLHHAAEGIAHEGISRPHSQPTLPAGAATTAQGTPDIYDEFHALHGGGLESQQPAFATVLGEQTSPAPTPMRNDQRQKQQNEGGRMGWARTG